ncbi:MAG: hypothetical protein R2781_07615 [Flavobacteriaceae bacterium]
MAKVTLNPKIDLKQASILFKRNSEEFREIAAMDSVFIYLVQNNQIIKSTQTGVYIPASKKDIPFPVPVNAFRVPLVKGISTDIYIQAFDKNSIFPMLELKDISIPIKNESNALNIFLIILSSTAFILGFYVLFFFFFTKDISYFYLSIAFLSVLFITNY